MVNLKMRAEQLGLVMPPINDTSFAYRPALRVGKMVYLAGQIPKVSRDTILHTGRLGIEVDFQAASECVRCCVLNGLAWIDALTRDDAAQVVQVLRVNYYFQVAETGEPPISALADIGSQLLTQVFGEAGSHVRSVIGVRALPRNSPVLLDLELRLQ